MIYLTLILLEEVVKVGNLEDLTNREVEKEKVVKDKLEKILKSNRFKVKREVVPDECKGWDNPYKVDMVVEPFLGPRIGIEVKTLESLGQGSFPAKAFEQIVYKYMGKHYNDRKILLWAYFPYMLKDTHEASDKHTFIREFFNHFGIGYLSLTFTKPKIVWVLNKSYGKVYLSQCEEHCRDYTKLKDYVRKKRRNLDIFNSKGV